MGTDHTEYYCTPKEALEIIPDLPYYYDEPFADSSAIPTILVSRLARKKVTVALSADAGDEVFAGYNRYEFLLKYQRKINRLPAPLRRAVAGVMDTVSSDTVPFLRKKYNFHSRYQKLKGLLRESSSSQMIKSTVEFFSPRELQRLFPDGIAELSTRHVSDELTKEHFDELSYMLAVDYQTYLTDDILQKVDRATMSVSLEGREPFLDQDIIQWVAQLPSSYKYHQGEKKHLLKEIVYRHLSKEIMKRPKMGFSIPIDRWLSIELKDLVMQYLDDNMMSHGLFDKKEVKKMRDAFYGGKPDTHIKLWNILMFQMWYDKWM